MGQVADDVADQPVAGRVVEDLADHRAGLAPVVVRLERQRAGPGGQVHGAGPNADTPRSRYSQVVTCRAASSSSLPPEAKLGMMARSPACIITTTSRGAERT